MGDHGTKIFILSGKIIIILIRLGNGINNLILPCRSWRIKMVKTIEAIYENGVLKPLDPLDLREHERVKIVLIKTGNVARMVCFFTKYLLLICNAFPFLSFHILH
mgnify:CR=1 FL=1